ncbi:3-deoxy-D-arabino-heptulosonate 7-phosphate synthase [Parapusillimonas sp. JC17]|uniref:3-deoxy-D-arabino-heptulosonate 7-phosphate synthase n=1 Tax=Parapusillimonas sp. JC17 TaxID=3445768 RepID=UPI003FA132B4
MAKRAPPGSTLIDETLRIVDRRYRLPPFVDALAGPDSDPGPGSDPQTVLALVIEQARRAEERGNLPDVALEMRFTGALARLIHNAMKKDGGDPAFQAMVLRHRVVQVREYASLSAHADRDRRAVKAIVNRIAHPAKQQRAATEQLRKAMGRLHALAAAASWPELHAEALHLLAAPKTMSEPAFESGLTELVGHPALEHLQRLGILASDESVRRYQELWNRQGPRSGSATAIAQGAVSQRRGAAVEASAARAFEAWARRLNEAEGERAAYRVVTSMRVPASIPGASGRAKTEWDVVLLHRAGADAPQWDICLLAEAKASVDAAATDLPRLLRGLRLLAGADGSAVYSFQTQQGTVHIRGASLAKLHTDKSSLASAVLYCCDVPAEESPRLLSAASRMQLLSARASLDFAGALADGHRADSRALALLWDDLMKAPEWKGVLQQYATLRQVRQLMVHTDDLLAAIDNTGRT